MKYLFFQEAFPNHPYCLRRLFDTPTQLSWFPQPSSLTQQHLLYSLSFLKFFRSDARVTFCSHPDHISFPCGSAGKESASNMGDLGSIPELGRSPGEGKGYPLHYSGLENSMDCIVHGVANSWTWLSDFHKTVSINLVLTLQQFPHYPWNKIQRFLHCYKLLNDMATGHLVTLMWQSGHSHIGFHLVSKTDCLLSHPWGWD